jgi:hypothetical protein
MLTDEKKEYTSEKNVILFDTLTPLLNALYSEIQVLSKKKPDGTLSANKTKVINRLLIDIKDFLNDEPTNKYLDLLEDENLPQYSDVALMLSQYSAALTQFKSRYYGWTGSDHGWFINMKI